MADGSLGEAAGIDDANVAEEKGIETNEEATVSSTYSVSSSQEITFNCSVETPHIGGGEREIDEGKEIDGTTKENGEAIQVTTNDPKECLRNGDKEVIVLDDDEDHAHLANKAIKDELTGDPNINGRNEKTPRVGMVFTSYDELNNYFKQYALRVGFGVAVKKSSFTKKGVCRRLVLACSKGGTGRTDAMYQARRTAKTNCEVMVSAKSHGDGFLHLVEVKLEHNHPVNPSTARFMRCYKRMAGSFTDYLVEQPSGDNDMLLAEKECGNATEIGKLKLAEGDDEAIHQFFASMQNKNPNFFYLVDLDQHGRLRNLFWADARSRAAYQYFGDVVTFDTTYLIDKYDLPLVSFVGMNHHGQLVLLGCGLVSDETADTYLWLFKAWLTSMSGCLPHAIITDQCESIKHAVAEVFPGTRHRVCLAQILKKIPDKLRGLAEFKEVKKKLKKTVYDSLRVEEFEENWKQMIESHGLESNEWLKTLYDDRHYWVPVFLKDNSFWAGMSVSQRGECVATFFDGCVYPRTSIKQFFNKCEMTLLGKFKKEAQTDSESFHKTPLIISKFYMEEQLSKVYTLNMFKKFQDELKATMYCHVTPVKADGSIITFDIKECSYIEDGKRTESKDHEVLFNADTVEVQCICGFYNFHGILCRHVLSVFKFQQIFEIPSDYIVDRWKKDYKRLQALVRASHDVLVNDLSERYDYLSMRFLQLVDAGFISEDRYQLSLKLIRELEKSLLDDTSARERQPKLLCFEANSSQNIQNLLVSPLGFSEGNVNRNPSSIPVKRRGRPPKRGRESNVEPLVRTNKEQDFLRSAMMANEDTVLQGASTVSHLDTQIGQGGIDLMEDLNPSDLSFDTHFNLHVSQQHHMSNQTRLQPNNLLPSQYEQQTMSNQNGFPWIYQQILQEDQISKVPSIRRPE